ncbi:MAG: hypothetical protein VCC01_05670, partial [Candidatus Hydrogenedentota bacterium]
MKNKILTTMMNRYVLSVGLACVFGFLLESGELRLASAQEAAASQTQSGNSGSTPPAAYGRLIERY